MDARRQGRRHVHHVVDVVAAEAHGGARPQPSIPSRRVGMGGRLDQLAVDDDERTGGPAVVVQLGRPAGRPHENPRIEVVSEQDAGVAPLDHRRRIELAPRRGDLGKRRAQVGQPRRPPARWRDAMPASDGGPERGQALDVADVVASEPLGVRDRNHCHRRTSIRRRDVHAVVVTILHTISGDDARAERPTFGMVFRNV